jgi:hypothetical protein
VNGDHFRQLARQADWWTVRKYVHSQEFVEALLFGVCGMLEGPPVDPRQGTLKEAWEFLRHKHQLRARPLPFKCHRMHPAGFPALRIAQLAMVAVEFRPLGELMDAPGMRRFSQEWAPSSDYWGFRFDFGNTLNPRRMELGADTRERVVANALAPMAYLCLRLEQGGDPGARFGRVLDLLREFRPEKNKIIRMFGPLGLSPANALQSQGLVGLHKEQCTAFRCCQCAIGRKVLGMDPGQVPPPAPAGGVASPQDMGIVP